MALKHEPPRTPAWKSVPIDPALQATPGYYQSHYPPSGYIPYSSPTTATPTPTRQPTGNAGGGGKDPDLATLNDALGSAGVDLRAEEESLQRSHEPHQPYRTYEDRTRKQPPKPSFDTRFLAPTMRTVASNHKITRVPDDSVNYLALALRTRLQDLITAMIAAASHRTDTQFDRPASLYADPAQGEGGEDPTPMWSILVRSDVAKQLAAIEKVEREEELRIRRERKERVDMQNAHAAALAAQAAGNALAAGAGGGGEYEDDGGGGKKKKRKEGPGVTARNMSEDVRKKMSNAVASQAAGLGGKYSWMNAANSSGAVATPRKAAAAAAVTPAATPAAAASVSGGSGWARPYVSTKKTTTPAPAQETVEDDSRMAITLRDAMFVIEKERGHGGGRGSARGWT